MIKNKKILVFAHDASLYGAAQSLLTLLEGIAENNFAEIFVILPHKGKMEEAFKSKGINYKVIDIPRCFTWEHSKNFFQKINQIIKYNSSVRSIIPKLKSVIKDFNPDMIYSNTSIVSIGYVLAKKINLPHVWHIREFGDLDYNFEYLPTKKKVIKQMRASEKVIFVSKSLQKHWYEKEIDNSVVIYNGLVKNDRAYPQKTYPLQNFRIGILGAILPGKGQDIAIKAIGLLVKKHPSIVLYLYGNIVDKEYYKKLEQLIKDLDCSVNIVFTGFEEDQDLIYSNLDVLLNCSAMEGFGRTIIEAMHRGIPVIANAAGGPLEIIKHKENGLLYNHSPESLAEYIDNLLNNKELYTHISEMGKQNALNYYVKTYVNNVCDILTSVFIKTNN